MFRVQPSAAECGKSQSTEDLWLILFYQKTTSCPPCHHRKQPSQLHPTGVGFFFFSVLNTAALLLFFRQSYVITLCGLLRGIGGPVLRLRRPVRCLLAGRGSNKKKKTERKMCLLLICDCHPISHPSCLDCYRLYHRHHLCLRSVIRCRWRTATTIIKSKKNSRLLDSPMAAGPWKWGDRDARTQTEQSGSIDGWAK